MADIEKRYERIGNQPTAIVEASKGKTFGKYHYVRSEFADFTQQKRETGGLAFLISRGKTTVLSQIFHQDLGITAVAQLGNALFSDLPDTLASEA